MSGQDRITFGEAIAEGLRRVGAIDAEQAHQFRELFAEMERENQRRMGVLPEDDFRRLPRWRRLLRWWGD